MQLTTLDKLIPGESGRVQKLTGRGAVRRRLVDMGLTSGAEIEMVKVSPLGDPVEYRLRGYHLSLRRTEAETIVVEMVKDLTPHSARGHYFDRDQSLLRCKKGQRVVITRIRGGARLHQKTELMGLTPGTEILVIQNEYPGPLIYADSEGARKILGKGMARQIMVKTTDYTLEKDRP